MFFLLLLCCVVLCCVLLNYSMYDVMGWMDIYLEGWSKFFERKKAFLGLDALGWDEG